MYKAHTVLTRGRSTLEKGFLWVRGQGESVIRYVHAPAYNAHAAHMVSGWQQNDAKAASMLLGVYDLPAYMGHRPHFWPVSVQGYENMPDSATGTAAIAFWRDICSSLCYRWHDDDVEMMQVDLRPGVYEGDWTNARPSKCHCYAYDDLAKLNYTGQASEISHEAPNDMAMARFLSTAKLVNNYVGTGTRPSDGVAIPDEGERYRRFINTYAVHRDPWESYFVVEEQASVFHRLALEPGYFFEPEDTMNPQAYRIKSNVADTNACVRECVVIGEAGPLEPVPKNRMSFATMGFIEGETGPNCWCFAKDLLHPDYDHLIVHDPTRLKIKMYRTKLCVGVSGGSERSVVYRKGVMGANAVCLGMPVGVGMILANGSVFLSRDAADDTRPIDVQCRSACDANPDCALAHSFVSTPLEHFTQYKLQTRTPSSPLTRTTAAAQVETFSVAQMAHALPPPPEPPAPPMPPPPRVPPLPPFPPAPPPDGIVGLRTWSPSNYNSAPEGPDDGSNAFFYMYCGFGLACGEGEGFRAPFHKSVSQLSILNTARNMIDQGTYKSSACPYECSRKLTRHEVVQSNEANMLSGIGMQGENFIYPGHQDSTLGFSRFPSSGDPGQTGRLHALHMSHNVTLDQCDDIVRRHQLLSPHGVWLVNEANEDASPTTASAERIGDCGLFLGARSSVDADIWRAFYKYARLVLRLGHVDTWLDDDIVDAVVHSSSERECNAATSKVCLWWSEFDLDEEEYSCRPKRDASNIITPSILLATLAENNVAYPPPSPPPPTPPEPPPGPSPPPGALRCELSAIASTSGYKVPAYDPTLGRYVPVQKKCWRWDTANDWPPFVAHRDLYVERDRCSGARSRDVQWDGGFKQSLLASGTFDPLYQNNDDCPWKARTGGDALLNRLARAGDGAFCSDGGDETRTADQNRDDAMCDLGTNIGNCGIRKNLVVFGYAHHERYDAPRADLAAMGNGYFKAASVRRNYGPVSMHFGLGKLHAIRSVPYRMPCVSRHTNKLHTIDESIASSECHDGGPGAVDALCYYGTDPLCGKRRFAFALEDAGPDVPDDTCGTGTVEMMDGSTHEYGPNNHFCEDGLMWSHFPPGKNPCAPNTDVRPEFEPVLCIYTTQLVICIPKTR